MRFASIIRQIETLELWPMSPDQQANAVAALQYVIDGIAHHGKSIFTDEQRSAAREATKRRYPNQDVRDWPGT